MPNSRMQSDNYTSAIAVSITGRFQSTSWRN